MMKFLQRVYMGYESTISLYCALGIKVISWPSAESPIDKLMNLPSEWVSWAGRFSMEPFLARAIRYRIKDEHLVAF